MVYVERSTGACAQAKIPPGPDWDEVPGRGALFRRHESTGWRAAHAFEPDSPLWFAQGWERVRFVPAEAVTRVQTGSRSGMRFAMAPRHRTEARLRPADGVWVILPDEPAVEAPAGRPGSQSFLSQTRLREGLDPLQVAIELFASRIAAADIAVDRARAVLTGPPVSPADSKIARRLQPVLALAARLAEDLRIAAGALDRSTDVVAPPRPRRSARARTVE